MEMEIDPLEGSSYNLGVTVKAEIKEEEEDDHYNTINTSNAVSRRRRVSYEQLKCLCEFLYSNRDVAVGLNKTTQAKVYSKRMWEDVSETLNSFENGAYKDGKGWCTYWVDYKAKLKKKLAVLRGSQNPDEMVPLSDIEKKFLSILGDSFGSGLSNTQENPLGILSSPTHIGSDTKQPQPKQEQASLDRPLQEEIKIQEKIDIVEEPIPSFQEVPLTKDKDDPDKQTLGPERPKKHRRRRPLTQKMAREELVEISRARMLVDQENSRSLRQIAEGLKNSNVVMQEMLGTLNRIAAVIDRALLELAQCVQTNQEPIEFNSTDAMMDPKTGLMICLHCLEDFDSNLLSDHMINAHNYRRVLFKCHICQNTFQERKLLSIHRQECQPESKVRKRKSFQQIFKEIEEKYFGEGQEDLLESVSCPICLLELPKYCLKEHMINEHRKPDVILTCGRCNRNFKSKLTLREHVKLVHEAVEDSEECELCGQKFRSLKYLSNHKRNVHPTGNKIHACSVCGKQFKSRLCLHQHSKYVHPPSTAAVSCPQCPSKVFKSRINLAQHLKVAHGWKRSIVDMKGPS